MATAYENLIKHLQLALRQMKQQKSGHWGRSGHKILLQGSAHGWRAVILFVDSKHQFSIVDKPW